MTDYAKLTKFITEHIVEHPESVVVVETPKGRSTLVEVEVADDDMGKIIGKGGRNIEAMRSVVRAAGLRRHERVQVELVEEDEPEDDAAEGEDGGA